MKINVSTRYDSVMRMEAAVDAQRAGSPRPLREVGDQVVVGGGGRWRRQLVLGWEDPDIVRRKCNIINRKEE